MLDINEVSEGLIGVYACLMQAVDTLGEARVSKFLDTVPERGEALWVRFRSWQRTGGEYAGFQKFIQSFEQNGAQPEPMMPPSRPGELFVQRFVLQGSTWEKLEVSPVDVMGLSKSAKLPSDVVLNGFAGPGGKTYMRAYHTPSGKFAWYELKK